MAKLENEPHIDLDKKIADENILPGHFYAAYIFDRVETRRDDIKNVLEQAQNLGYPIRYWWLSAAIDLGGCPDRMIVCVHHPSSTFDAGMDLYNALSDRQVQWDDLEAAAIDEYRDFGLPVNDILNIYLPNGQRLFPPLG